MASPKREKQRQVRATVGRPNRRPLSLPAAMRRAMLHSFLCFLVGLITGFTPSHWTTTLFCAINNHTTSMSMSILLQPVRHPQHYSPPPLQQPQLLVVVTATELSDPERRAAGLTRTAHALRLVPPPLLWLVVEEPAAARHRDQAAARLLRGAGVVYRHLTYRDNFTDTRAERHHQRNVALGHVEEHRLAGVVLFAGLGDVYDLRFFHHLREIRTLGAWPVATVWDQYYERKVVVEGPLCAAGGSVVTGWFSSTSTSTAVSRRASRPPVDMDVQAGFAFSSSLLWDPRRWDRFPISEPDASQDSVRFVQRLVVEEYNKSRGIPDPDCSEIMVWRGDHLLAA